MVLTASKNDLEIKSAQLKQGLHFANHTAGGQILVTEMNSSDFDDKTTKRIVIKFYINLTELAIYKRFTARLRLASKV